jgi:DNA-binding transcriptional ArsR family regulator
MTIACTQHFVIGRTMDADSNLAAVAAAIAEPARARMLCSLLDGCARTATELAALAEIGASTASGHLARLREQGLVEVAAQGKHRYVRLAGADVAAALEALLVVAGVPRTRFRPSTPPALRAARTCYDHMAGEVAVKLHDALLARHWLAAHDGRYEVTRAGEAALDAIGIDIDSLRARRRRLACPCMDWSERRPHLGGALGAALLDLAVKRGWIGRRLDSRALRLTAKGAAQLAAQFGVRPPAET